MKRQLIMVITCLVLLGTLFMPVYRASAQEVTDANLDQSIAAAKTPAEHEAIAAYYDKEAADAEAKAKLHHAMHHRYEDFKMKPADMAHHCDELAKYFERVADQDKALAKEHREMAKKAAQ